MNAGLGVGTYTQRGSWVRWFIQLLYTRSVVNPEISWRPRSVIGERFKNGSIGMQSQLEGYLDLSLRTVKIHPYKHQKPHLAQNGIIDTTQRSVLINMPPRLTMQSVLGSFPTYYLFLPCYRSLVFSSSKRHCYTIYNTIYIYFIQPRTAASLEARHPKVAPSRWSPSQSDH